MKEVKDVILIICKCIITKVYENVACTYLDFPIENDFLVRNDVNIGLVAKYVRSLFHIKHCMWEVLMIPRKGEGVQLIVCINYAVTLHHTFA